jgi:hypothetical protein
MYIKFNDADVDRSKEYVFWRQVTNWLVMESTSSRSDLIKKYLYEQYGLTLVEYVGDGNSLKLRSIDGPDEMESFFRLKYEEFK